MPGLRRRSTTETRRDQSRALHTRRRRRARASPRCTAQGWAISHDASSAGLDTSRRGYCKVMSACRAVVTTQAGDFAARRFRAVETAAGSAGVSAWPAGPPCRRGFRTPSRRPCRARRSSRVVRWRWRTGGGYRLAITSGIYSCAAVVPTPRRNIPPFSLTTGRRDAVYAGVTVLTKTTVVGRGMRDKRTGAWKLIPTFLRI